MPSLFEEIKIKDEELQDLVEKAKDWALMHGAGMRSKENFSPDSLNFAPFTLFPTPMKRQYFEEAVSLQTTLGELMHNVAQDYEFLKTSLEKTIKVDEFTEKLFEIYDTVRNEGIKQEISLELTRSDYLEDTIKKSLKQVEFNTIACSFGGMASTNVRLQSYILKELGLFDKLKHMPKNNALSGYCSGIVEAWKMFNVEKSCVLFIVEDITYNICDQRFMEFEIREQEPRIVVLRRTFTQLYREATLGPNKELFVGTHRVAIVYFRCGYDPTHYQVKGAWHVRLLIEKSDAIKCPSINFHLVGTKKVQEVLARPNVLERFIDADRAERIRNLFTDIYPLDKNEPGGQEAEKLLRTDPEEFVLKPQREGGGNNIYGNDITSFISSQHEDSEWRSSFIVMRMIRPQTYNNCIVKPDSSILITKTISELGIFSVLIGTSSKIFYNKQTGHMLRTKPYNCNEGGVASGFGALDSPYLV